MENGKRRVFVLRRFQSEDEDHSKLFKVTHPPLLQTQPPSPRQFASLQGRGDEGRRYLALIGSVVAQLAVHNEE